MAGRKVLKRLLQLYSLRVCVILIASSVIFVLILYADVSKDVELDRQIKIIGYIASASGLFAIAAAIANDVQMKYYMEERKNEKNGIGIIWALCTGSLLSVMVISSLALCVVLTIEGLPAREAEKTSVILMVFSLIMIVSWFVEMMILVYYFRASKTIKRARNRHQHFIQNSPAIENGINMFSQNNFVEHMLSVPTKSNAHQEGAYNARTKPNTEQTASHNPRFTFRSTMQVQEIPMSIKNTSDSNRSTLGSVSSVTSRSVSLASYSPSDNRLFKLKTQNTDNILPIPLPESFSQLPAASYIQFSNDQKRSLPPSYSQISEMSFNSVNRDRQKWSFPPPLSQATSETL